MADLGCDGKLAVITGAGGGLGSHARAELRAHREHVVGRRAVRQLRPDNYGTAKAGLVGFTRVLSVEGAKNNIKANAIAPVAKTRRTEELLGTMPDKLAPPSSPRWWRG